jgi:hypothetical protein
MARDSGIALGSLIAAKIVCCGGFALAATGMLSGLGAWLTDSGYLWVGGAAGILVLAAVLLYRRRGRGDGQGGTDATAGQYARPVP